MHQDQKVGLALGVLLIGVVAAFFFRNESPNARPVPSLKHAAELKREISEKRWTPYFSDVETDVSSPAAPPEAVAGTTERTLPTWKDIASGSAEDPFADDVENYDSPLPAPDPIQYETPAVAESVPVEPIDSEIPGDAMESVLSPARFHEVQRGDTLSSIAGKYLGSQVRFPEIFEANRDLLNSPNDLQIGMRLRIPNAAATTAERIESKTVSQTERISADEIPAAEKPDDLPRKPDTEEIPRIGAMPQKTDLKFTPVRRRRR